MGLDMYGYTMNAEFVGDRQTDVNVSEDERDEAELNQFAYWRKFNHLHGWMEKLYRQTFAQPVRHPHQPALRLHHPAPLQQYRKRQHRPRFGALQRQLGQQQISQRRLRRVAQPLAVGLNRGL